MGKNESTGLCRVLERLLTGLKPVYGLDGPKEEVGMGRILRDSGIHKALLAVAAELVEYAYNPEGAELFAKAVALGMAERPLMLHQAVRHFARLTSPGLPRPLHPELAARLVHLQHELLDWRLLRNGSDFYDVVGNVG